MPVSKEAEVSGGRQQEIVDQYLVELDKHLLDIKNGLTDTAFEIKDMADILHIHPRHLSNTIHKVLGKSPCDLYEERLIALAKELLLTTTEPVAAIARRMTYDPSNFSKFFKLYVGMTPGQFRTSHVKN